MLEWIQIGGPIMLMILLVSLIGLATFIERLFHYHRAQIRTDDFMRGIFNVLRTDNRVEAITLCEETPGPVSKIVHAALLRLDDGPERMNEAMNAAGLLEIPRLERRLNLLATVGVLAPLLGLFGTVLGLMSGLDRFSEAPLAHHGHLASGLWQALLTTGFGLAVAIAAYAGYNLLLARVDSLLLDMEQAAQQITDRFAFKKRKSGEGEK
ncbi:MAG: MotA/TolQ/ExbB proton channel family protein [Kiritimatiellia bacterium]|nr:MotA/TolQ/ExbB proton channel family protein [Kiritimatiellia bacterium]